MILLDFAQIEIEKSLSELAGAIKKKQQKTRLQKIFSKTENIKSLYIYGDVGRGKTMLMRGFFHNLLDVKKSYFHFNVFMNLIHENLHEIRSHKLQVNDELIEAVDRVVGESKVICFDEFQVTDIADAMLLSRIFSYIFARDILVVFTSNLHPSELYKNGLQRELFLKFVNEVLLKNCVVKNLNSKQDYRQTFNDNLAQTYFLNSKENCQIVKQIIKNFAEKDALKPHKIKVWGREIKIKRANKKIAIFDFKELFFENFAASDYRAICQKFSAVFLINLPQFNEEDVNEARRFTLFIDEVYENKLALIILASCDIGEIYNKTKNISYAARTMSRLQEIKSSSYWSNSKIKN